jgi:pilus assembly protein Flp/PilA
MTNLFARFAKEENGATAIEYGLIAAILSVAIIAAVSGVKEELNETFESVSGELAANNTP